MYVDIVISNIFNLNKHFFVFVFLMMIFPQKCNFSLVDDFSNCKNNNGCYAG